MNTGRAAVEMPLSPAPAGERLGEGAGPGHAPSSSFSPNELGEKGMAKEPQSFDGASLDTRPASVKWDVHPP